MICQCTAGGRTKGSWEFFSDGQRLLVFDAESGEYRANNSRGEQMKDEWERDDDLTKAFNFYSTRDCQGWLQFLVPRKKELETTGKGTQGRRGHSLEDRLNCRSGCVHECMSVCVCA